MPGPETSSPIRIDESRAVIVVYCTEHEWWTAARFFRDDAYDAACGHEEREHPNDDRHRHARRERERYRRVANAQPPASCQPARKV